MKEVERAMYQGIPYFVGQSVWIKLSGGDREGHITRIEQGFGRPSLFCKSGNMFGVFPPDSVELIVKTFEGFDASGLDDFDAYLHVGDAVGEDIFDGWLNVSPPLIHRSGYLQQGEAAGQHLDRDGKWHNTYRTLEQYGGVWRYMGLCCKGEDVHRGVSFYRLTA